MNRSFCVVVPYDGEEYRFTGTMEPIIPAKTQGDPYYCHPQEGGDIEVEKVEVGTGKDQWAEVPPGDYQDSLVELLWTDIQDRAAQQIAERDEQAKQDAADARLDRARGK